MFGQVPTVLRSQNPTKKWTCSFVIHEKSSEWWMLLRSQIMFSSTDTYWHHEIELCCTAWSCFWVWNWQGLLSRHLQNMLEEHMMPPVVTSKITIHVILVKTWASTAGVQRSKSSRKVPKQPQKHWGLGGINPITSKSKLRVAMAEMTIITTYHCWQAMLKTQELWSLSARAV